MASFTADGIDLIRADHSVYFWIERGWLDEPAATRGEDDVVPLAEGRLVRGRQRDYRDLELRGSITGIGASEAAADAAFLALLIELQPVFFDASVDPWPLVAADGYRGLAAGQTATIYVRARSVTPVPSLISWQREYSVTLRSVDAPPEWVLS